MGSEWGDGGCRRGASLDGLGGTGGGPPRQPMGPGFMVMNGVVLSRFGHRGFSWRPRVSMP